MVTTSRAVVVASISLAAYPGLIVALILFSMPVFSSADDRGQVPATGAETTPIFILPDYRLAPEQLAVIVNDASMLSVRLGSYYQKRRKIPAANLIHVNMPVDMADISPAQFTKIRADIFKRTPGAVQAYVMTWMMPYRVGCMSITSALTLGYDVAFCQQQKTGVCRQDKQGSGYFNSFSSKPFKDHNMRPSMLLAARDWAGAKALVERGIGADARIPTGTAYLVSTSDKARDVRALQYEKTVASLGSQIHMQTPKTDALQDRNDVLFYFTGLAWVKHLDSLSFVPGAIADHLTSAGGFLNGTGQMSIMQWLEAGATGSYGTVTEPCNYPQKFPVPGIVMQHYLMGASLIEAYWKSVLWPREGVFIGEPLAAPYAGYRVERVPGQINLQTFALKPGVYQLYTSASVLGPYTRDSIILTVRPGQHKFYFPDLQKRVYKLVKLK